MLAFVHFDQAVGQDLTGVTKSHFGGQRSLPKPVQRHAWILSKHLTRLDVGAKLGAVGPMGLKPALLSPHSLEKQVSEALVKASLLGLTPGQHPKNN